MEEAHDFDELVERYLAGDLDAIERRALDAEIGASDAARARFDAAWDRHTAEHGLTALPSPDPARRDCFSPRTLERFVDGGLTPADAELVASHLDCHSCRFEVEAIRGSARPRTMKWRPRARHVAVTGICAALAAAAALVLWPMPTQYRGDEFFDDRLAAPRFYVLQDGGAQRPWRPGEPLEADAALSVRLENLGTEPLYYAVLVEREALRRWLVPSSIDIVEPMEELPPRRTMSTQIAERDHRDVVVVIVSDKRSTMGVLEARVRENGLDVAKLRRALGAEVLVDRAP